jgi:hypothetical protein
VEDLLPKFHIIGLGHQTSLVAVGNVLNYAVRALQLNQLSPNLLLSLNVVAAVEVQVLYLTLQLQPLVPVAYRLAVNRTYYLPKMVSLVLRAQRVHGVLELFHS